MEKKPLNLWPFSSQFLPELLQEIFYLFIFKFFPPHFLNTGGSWHSRGQVFLFPVLRCIPSCAEPPEGCCARSVTHTFPAGVHTSSQPGALESTPWCTAASVGCTHCLSNALALFVRVPEPGSPARSQSPRKAWVGSGHLYSSWHGQNWCANPNGDSAGLFQSGSNGERAAPGYLKSFPPLLSISSNCIG